MSYQAWAQPFGIHFSSFTFTPPEILLKHLHAHLWNIHNKNMYLHVCNYSYAYLHQPEICMDWHASGHMRAIDMFFFHPLKYLLPMLIQTTYKINLKEKDCDHICQNVYKIQFCIENTQHHYVYPLGEIITQG